MSQKRKRAATDLRMISLGRFFVFLAGGLARAVCALSVSSLPPFCGVHRLCSFCSSLCAPQAPRDRSAGNGHPNQEARSPGVSPLLCPGSTTICVPNVEDSFVCIISNASCMVLRRVGFVFWLVIGSSCWRTFRTLRGYYHMHTLSRLFRVPKLLEFGRVSSAIVKPHRTAPHRVP